MLARNSRLKIADVVEVSGVLYIENVSSVAVLVLLVEAFKGENKEDVQEFRPRIANLILVIDGIVPVQGERGAPERRVEVAIVAEGEGSEDSTWVLDATFYGTFHRKDFAFPRRLSMPSDLQQYGNVLEQSVGGSVLSSFGASKIASTDPSDAVNCCSPSGRLWVFRHQRLMPLLQDIALGYRSRVFSECHNMLSLARASSLSTAQALSATTMPAHSICLRVARVAEAAGDSVPYINNVAVIVVKLPGACKEQDKCEGTSVLTPSFVCNGSGEPPSLLL
ncbi:uncharacterized protein ARMOST_06171 [Armillaria ostoyae]|uniref:Uncharacterized protein n=1 Tax=Armillaria ostoyae TaxID=47428 RepID=A0A284R288_ARMOS|nr:uncharacterized protein ARMOST_06171 [Armillaria ostoyae]